MQTGPIRRRRQRLVALLAATALLIPVSAPSAAVAAGPACTPKQPFPTYLQLISQTGGAPGNRASGSPYISGDGRFVAFTSQATDLVTGDTTSATYDSVFVYDRTAGGMQRISLGAGGIEPDGVSRFPALSRSGKFVAFVSAATNLVAGDTNAVADLFVADRTPGPTVRASISSGGTQSDKAYVGAGPSISADGHYVTFLSPATTLVSGKTTTYVDAYLRDTTGGTTTRVNLGPAGVEANADTTAVSLSPDGTLLAYTSGATNLVSADNNSKADVFLYDLAAATTTRVSVSSNGTEGDGDSVIASAGAVSQSGNYVTYASKATNLVQGDTNGFEDIFVYNRQLKQTERISIAATGTQGNGDSWGAVISDNGQYVVFVSAASNLTTGVTPGHNNVYRYDRFLRKMELVSATRFGTAGNGDSYAATVSADGRYIAFVTTATDLVKGKSTTQPDVVVRDMTAPSFPLDLKSASGTGNQVTLTYTRTLDSASVPQVCDYTVSVGGVARTISKVAVGNNMVTLTLSPGLLAGDTVKVSYSPGAAPVQDPFKITAQPLAAYDVPNKSWPVSLRSAVVTGRELVLTYDRDLDTTSVPNATDFSVKVGAATPAAPTGVQMDSRRVRLQLAAAVPTGSYVTVSYTVGTVPLQDRNGSGAAGFVSQAVDNQTVALVMTSLTGAYNKIMIGYNLNLDPNTVPDVNDFQVTISGGTPIHPASVNIAARSVQLVLPSLMQESDAVTVDYTPGVKPLQTLSWSPAGPLSAQPVVNSTVAPRLQSATANATQMVMTFNRKLDASAVPSPADFAVTVNSAPPSAPTRVAIDSNKVVVDLASNVLPGDSVQVAYTPGTSPLQDTVGSRVQAITAFTATNATPAPVLRFASVTADRITLTYSRDLDPASVPAAADFTVKVAGRSVSLSGVTINRKAAILTLPASVVAGDAVTLAYTPGTAPLRDPAGSPAAAILTGAPQTVINQTTAPTLGTVRVNGSRLVLTFRRPLDATAVPAAADFAVTVGAGTPAAPTAVTVTNMDVTLTLAAAVRPGQVVTLSYTPGTTRLREAGGSPVLAIVNRTATNLTTPVFVAAYVHGAQLQLTYNADLNANSVPPAGSYAVRLNGTATTASSVTVQGRTVTVWLSAAALPNDPVTVSYTAGSTPVTDKSGNLALNLTNQAVVNQTFQPQLVFSAVNTRTITLGFNRPLDTTSVPAATSFTLAVAGKPSPPTVTAVAISGSRVVLTLSAPVVKNDLVTLSYSQGSLALRDTLRSLVPNLTGISVLNSTVR